jgi:hypothetical protein
MKNIKKEIFWSIIEQKYLSVFFYLKFLSLISFIEAF